ncbi:MAG: T9SS type A sorting domain-containing protein [Chlorobi bacterium]|nr:T9SS type A sorting domain-containing protein [Chlorobiota bacterium]
MNLKAFISIVLFSTISFGLFAQSIPNSSFENWAQLTYFEEPDQFNTSNPLSYSTTNSANVTKTTDAHSGSFAARLETISTGNGILPGAVFIGQLGEETISGGIPFAERPDSVKGFAKYNVADLDTANVAVLFKKFGAPIGLCFIQFTGTQNNWEEFSAPVTWLIPVISPDTLATVIVSSTIFADPISSSTITVDDIHFIGANAPFPNGGFENWNEFSGEEADDWTSSNVFTLSTSGVSFTKTEDSFDGAFAAKLETKLTMFNDTLAVLTNGRFGDDGSFGGLPVSNNPDKLTGYYKYIPDGLDTAFLGMTLYRYNDNTGITSVLEETFIQLPPASEYTPFEIPVFYDQYPIADTVNIVFSAGNMDENSTNTGLGSILFIDALEISYKPLPTGIADKLTKDEFKVYPNPATENLNFEFTEAFQNDVNVTILNILGKTVLRKTINASQSQSFHFDVSWFDSGIYFYRLNTSGIEEFTGKFFVK